MTQESILKREMKKYLQSKGAFWSMVAGGSYAKPGDPDIISCYKGKFIAIEAKTPTGRQSDWQKLRQREIEDAGGIYILARSVDDVKKILERMK